METILLVEDNPTTRKLVRFSLEKRGYVVLEAADGRSALALMDQKPDLILQDIVLPDIDGFSLVSELRAKAGARATPIVTITDTGDGIPSDVRSRIFTPFFSTKPIGVGTGLGLSICHRIVTSFGGSISFESSSSSTAAPNSTSSCAI